MEIEEKIQFVQSATARMAEHTHPFIASVVGVDDSNTNPHVGSAFRLRGTRRLIVTAAHVFREARQRFGRVAVAAEHGAEPRLLPRDPVYTDDAHDIVIFDVADDYPENAIAFWPSVRVTTDDASLSSDYLFLHGFPAIRSHFSAIAGGLVNRSLPYGVMRREDDVPSDVADDQFAMDFDPANLGSLDGSSSEWIDPRGLSGSAVWRIGAAGSSAQDWSPDRSVLVGVVTQWRPDAKCLVATKCTVFADILHSL